jgi:chain length determinant protein tyrosine kinase EpsG
MAPAPERPIPARLSDRSIGQILANNRQLDENQVSKIVAHQREKHVRFGEAAVALGYANLDDVISALSQQFNYAYATEEQRKDYPELVAFHQPFSKQVEAIRAIRSWVMMRVFSEPQQTRRALAVVSPNSGDGKTFFAANLAVTLAQLGGRTLLVDVFRMPNQHGLSAILAGRTEKRVVQQIPAIPGLFLLPVGIGPPNPLELLERPVFALLMRELTSKFDHVIVDTSAGEFGADPAVISAKCGAALVVARKNASRISALKDLAGVLNRSTATVAGVIVNEYRG